MDADDRPRQAIRSERQIRKIMLTVDIAEMYDKVNAKLHIARITFSKFNDLGYVTLPHPP